MSRMWIVADPDGRPYVDPHPASGEAINAAVRKWNPRLMRRLRGQRSDWLEMKDRGYVVRQAKDQKA